MSSRIIFDLGSFAKRIVINISNKKHLVQKFSLVRTGVSLITYYLETIFTLIVIQIFP